MSSNFNFGTLQFDEEKNNFIVKIKQNEEDFISLWTISKIINDFSYINHKYEMLRALSILLSEENQEDYKDKLVIFDRNFPFDYMNNYIENSFSIKSDMDLIHRLGVINSFSPNLDVSIVNFLSFSFKTINTFLYHKVDKTIAIRRMKTMYSAYTRAGGLNKIIAWFSEEIRNITNYQSLTPIQRNFENSDTDTKDGYIRRIDTLKASTSENKEFISSYLGTIKKCIDYYFDNLYKIENVANYSSDKKNIEFYNKKFFKIFSELQRPTIGIIEGENIKLICINNLIDALYNDNNIKLKRFEKNSPGLFEVSVVIGFIALFLKESREDAEHQLRMSILETRYEEAKLDKATALKRFLNEQSVKNTEVTNDIDKIVTIYEDFLEREETNLIFDITNPYIKNNLLDLKKELLQKAIDTMFDGEINIEEIFELSIYG